MGVKEAPMCVTTWQRERREAFGLLKKWLGENLTKPYPSEGEKVQMAQQSGLTRAQVNTWFKNARRKMAKE